MPNLLSPIPTKRRPRRRPPFAVILERQAKDHRIRPCRRPPFAVILEPQAKDPRIRLLTTNAALRLPTPTTPKPVEPLTPPKSAFATRKSGTC